MIPEEKQKILETYKWIKVKRYEDDESKSWQERYSNPKSVVRRKKAEKLMNAYFFSQYFLTYQFGLLYKQLEKHHLEETNFLIDKIRELVQML